LTPRPAQLVVADAGGHALLAAVCDLFEALTGEAESAFQRLFGEEFSGAYERYLETARDEQNQRRAGIRDFPMTENNRIVWSEGLFLRPQHFQQQERFLETYIEERAAPLRTYPWVSGSWRSSAICLRWASWRCGGPAESFLTALHFRYGQRPSATAVGTRLGTARPGRRARSAAAEFVDDAERSGRG